MGGASRRASPTAALSPTTPTYYASAYAYAHTVTLLTLLTSGVLAELAYAIGLCYYQQKQFGPALKHLAEIIERGVREHPELSVGSQTEGIEVRPPWAS